MTEKEFAALCMIHTLVNITNGEELLADDDHIKLHDLSINHTKIGHIKCDHCNVDMLAVWDDLAPNGWIYQGIQITAGRNYVYSPVVSAIRQMEMLPELANSHSRVHTKPSTYNLKIKGGMEKNVKNYCNRCFLLSRNRILVKRNDITLAISVMPDETINSVLKDLDLLDGAVILGKGSVKEY